MGRLIDFPFCKFKGNCAFKKIVKPKNSKKRGVYYVICTSESGCNQKTYLEQKLVLPRPSVIPFTFNRNKASENWRRRSEAKWRI